MGMTKERENGRSCRIDVQNEQHNEDGTQPQHIQSGTVEQQHLDQKRWAQADYEQVIETQEREGRKHGFSKLPTTGGGIGGTNSYHLAVITAQQ